MKNNISSFDRSNFAQKKNDKIIHASLFSFLKKIYQESKQHRLIMTRRRSAARFPQTMDAGFFHERASFGLRSGRKRSDERVRRRGERRELKRGVALFNGRHFSPVEDTGFPRFSLISSSLLLLSLPHSLLSYFLFLLLLLLLFSLFFLSLPLSLSLLSHSRESDLDRSHHGQTENVTKSFFPPCLLLLPPSPSPPDSIPFHLTSRKLLFDSGLCVDGPRCSLCI